MSEFYKLRRTRITDAMALLGFLIGFFLPAYAAGRRMAEGFDLGLETQGLTYFVVTILTSAAAGGVIGLLAGLGTGWVWERLHKISRTSREDGDATGHSWSGATTSSTIGAGLSAGAAAGSATDSVSRPYPTIRFERSGVTAAGFMALLRKLQSGDRARPLDYDQSRVEAALRKTTNIGAWDGDRLVGVVRVLSDGYFIATVPEIIVDPEFRRRGIGRELMLRALDEAGNAVILFGAPPEASRFFERLGCQRAPSGYILRKKLAATVSTK
jgi:ribosomal protein S18 acetylase RimI-like enzyme